MADTPNNPNGHPKTRQELYDLIQSTYGTKEGFVLAEMKRLGFWKEQEGAPSMSEQLIKEKGDLYVELNKLLEKQKRYDNKEKMLKEMHQKRMKDALQRRQETKERQKKEKEERARVWADKKTRDIVYLGDGVSGGLNDKNADTARLAATGLPIFESVEQLAQKMEISIAELRFLSFSRRVSKNSHYRRFSLPKKSGGTRQISAPMPRLKNAQYWVLNNVLYKVENHQAAHGFVPTRSIVTNAERHQGSEVVINIDLKDFFPTISYRRVKGVFTKLGYSQQIATILALLCTEPAIDEVQIDGEKYYVAKGERFLPQGAPTSPAITNILCRRMDKRFAGMAAKLGWQYSRYADDLTFSSKGTADVNRILWQTRQIIAAEGFILHPDKLQVMRKGSRQEVTGIVVNKKMNVSRDVLKRFRAVLHQIETRGTAGVTWGNGNVLQTIQGFANYVKMVNPEKGAPLVEKVKTLLQRTELQSELKNLQQIQSTPAKKENTQKEKSVTPTENTAVAQTQTAKSKEEKNWWDIF